MAQVPDPILNDLRCLRCKQFLSCGPVTILENGGSLCGRCHIKNSNLFRAIAYETVAPYFLFRCKNWAKHCAYLLNWNDVLEHEENCVFGGTCSVCCNNPGVLFKADNKLDLTQETTVFNVPEQILQFLTCSGCGYYLSSTPIFVNPEGKSRCHRCIAIKGLLTPDYIRHEALEKILTQLLFPCIFRHRGCTKYFRFGSDTRTHEIECSYGQVQKKIPRRFTDSKGKERGVIETHTGHMYGTIKPNSAFFVAQEKVSAANGNAVNVEPIKVVPSEAQGVFFNKLMKHREHLVENKWRSSRLQDDDGSLQGDPRIPFEKSPNLNESNSRPSFRGQNYMDGGLQGVPRTPFERTSYDGVNQKPSFRGLSYSVGSLNSEPRTPNSDGMLQTPNYRGQNYGEELFPKSNFRNEPITREPSVSRTESYRREPRDGMPYQQSLQEMPVDDVFAYDKHSNQRRDYYDSEKRLQSASSISESQHSPDSPTSSITYHPNYNPPLTPIKLNPADLMHSNSFGYFDRFENPAHRNDSILSDGRKKPSLQYNGSFRN